MGTLSFAFYIALLCFLFWYGIRLSRNQRQRIKNAILENREKNKIAVELVRDGKMLQAENFLINQGMKRSVARVTAVSIKQLIREGEL